MKVKSDKETEYDRFNDVMNKLLSISKKEMDMRLAADHRGHSKSKAKKRKPAKASASRASGVDSKRA